MQIGKIKSIRFGLDGQHRELALLSTVSAVAKELQSAYVDLKVREIVARHRCPVIDKTYDATAKNFAFGALQQWLFPHARYPFKEDGPDQPWQLLSLADMVRKCPTRKVFASGVLNILASSIGCRWIDPEDSTFGGFDAFCEPKILENG